MLDRQPDVEIVGEAKKRRSLRKLPPNGVGRRFFPHR
jgi:hypothetical protein